MKRKVSTKLLSMMLALLMVLNVFVPAVSAAEVGELLSVADNVSVTVPYGTTLEEVMKRLPGSVAGKEKAAIQSFEEKLFTFDSSDELNDWRVYSDLITVKDGKLDYPSNTNVKAVTGSEDMTDYVVQADIKLGDNPTGDAGIMFRCTDVTAKGPDSYNGYYVGFGILDINATPLRIGLKSGYADGGWHESNRYEYSIDVSKSYTLRVVVLDNYHITYIKESDAPDSEFKEVFSETSSLFSHGSVGARSYCQPFGVDNFLVRPVEASDLEMTGLTKSVPVTVDVDTWTCDTEYDGTAAGKYNFTGTLKADNNADGLTTKAVVTVLAQPENINQDHSIPFSQVTVQDEFWSAKQKQMICEVIPAAIDRVSVGTGGIPNFKKAAEYLATKEGDNYTTTDAPNHAGAKYVDSDVYKLVEAMCYALQLDANGDQETLDGQAYILQTLETWIPWFVGSQEADGYLYTCYTLNSYEIPEDQVRFTGRKDDMPIQTDGTPYSTINTANYNADLDDHELYCVGHFYEAAVAHYRATGDTRLLDVAVKNANLVARVCGPDEVNQVQVVPGHQEIELALIKLAALCQELGGEYATHADDYIAVARFFLDERGSGSTSGYVYKHDGHNSSSGWLNGKYSQDLESAADLREAYGHCVRALYQYTGMADVAVMEVAAGNANPYDDALNALWESVAHRKQYITGGVGIGNNAEAFGADYYLPNDNTYCETCAQCALAFWSQRMSVLYGDSEYADQIERNLYNSIISCVNLDGNQFFYGNPLQSDNGGLRSNWFGTACCPPNFLRTVASVGSYIYNQEADGTIVVNQYIGNTASLNVAGNVLNVQMTTNMPWAGDSTFTVLGNGTFTVKFRVPEWATNENTFTVNGETVSATPDALGYVAITRTWAAGDTVEINFPFEPTRAYTDERITSNKGLVTVKNGPLVYAAEKVDNPNVDLSSVVLDKNAELVLGEKTRLPKREGEDHYGVETIVPITFSYTVKGLFGDSTGEVYMIPYYAWGNRGTTVMRTFFSEEAKEGTLNLAMYATVNADVKQSGNDGAQNVNNGKKDWHDAAHDRWCTYATSTDQHWIEYIFNDFSVTISSSTCTWYADGGGVEVPQKVWFEYWDGEAWQKVTNLTNDTVFPRNGDHIGKQEGDVTCEFDTITTNRIRMYPVLQSDAGKYYKQLGLMEWELLNGSAVNKTALKAYYDANNAIGEDGYTAESYAAYAAALANAEKVLASVTADQALVDETLEALKAAVEGLQEVAGLSIVNELTGETVKLTAEELEGLTITELAEKLGLLTCEVEDVTYSFAGWFTEDGNVASDADLTVGNTICAKFINAGYLNTTIAYTSNGTKATRVYALSTVPGDIFAKYGFVLSTAETADDATLRVGQIIDGLKVKDVAKTTVYTHISVAPFTTKATANAFNGALGGANDGDGYLTYAAISNMPVGKTVSARAYYVTLDGTMVYGAVAQTALTANNSVTGLN